MMRPAARGISCASAATVIDEQRLANLPVGGRYKQGGVATFDIDDVADAGKRPRNAAGRMQEQS